MDSIVTSELVSSLNGLSEEDRILLVDFSSSISNINSDIDLKALRLDWFRFQVINYYSSFYKYGFSSTG